MRCPCSCSALFLTIPKWVFSTSVCHTGHLILQLGDLDPQRTWPKSCGWIGGRMMTMVQSLGFPDSQGNTWTKSGTSHFPKEQTKAKGLMSKTKWGDCDEGGADGGRQKPRWKTPNWPMELLRNTHTNTHAQDQAIYQNSFWPFLNLPCALQGHWGPQTPKWEYNFDAKWSDMGSTHLPSRQLEFTCLKAELDYCIKWLGQDSLILVQFQEERSGDVSKQILFKGPDPCKPIQFESPLTLRTSWALPTSQAQGDAEKGGSSRSSVCIFFLFSLKMQCWFPSGFLDARMFTSLCFFFFSFLITRVVDICKV